MAKTKEEPKFISPKQLAEATGLTKTAIMKLIRKKAIKADKMGWNWLIPVTEIEVVKALQKQNE